MSDQHLTIPERGKLMFGSRIRFMLYWRLLSFNGWFTVRDINAVGPYIKRSLIIDQLQTLQSIDAVEVSESDDQWKRTDSAFWRMVQAVVDFEPSSESD